MQLVASLGQAQHKQVRPGGAQEAHLAGLLEASEDRECLAPVDGEEEELGGGLADEVDVEEGRRRGGWKLEAGPRQGDERQAQLPHLLHLFLQGVGDGPGHPVDGPHD